MPRAKVGKRYIIVRDFRKFPKKDDYVENFLKYENGKLKNFALCNSSGDPFSLVLRQKMHRLVDLLPRAIKRGNDLMFPIPKDRQVITLRHEGILGVFQYRKKIYAITYPIYDDEESE